MTAENEEVKIMEVYIGTKIIEAAPGGQKGGKVYDLDVAHPPEHGTGGAWIPRPLPGRLRELVSEGCA